MRRSLPIAFVVALLGCLGCAALGARWGAPSRLQLIDFANAADAARLGELRDDCPVATNGNARYQIVADAAASGGRALRLDYSLAASDATPVGVKIALSDLDASPYDHLELRLRSAAPSLAGTTARVGFRRPEAGGRGMVQNGSFAVHGVAAEWATFSIPLHSMVGIDHWTHLSEIFVAAEPAAMARRGAFLIDDIALVRRGDPGPAAAARPPTPRKRAWTDAAKRGPGVAAARRERLAGWPSRLLVPRQELPAGDEALLRRLAVDTWRGLDALRDREHGLPLDTVSFGESIDVETARIGDYTNITNVGLYLLAVAAAHELALIDRGTATQRAALVLDTLERLETHAGLLLQLLRHHVARAHDQLRFLRRLGLARPPG